MRQIGRSNSNAASHQKSGIFAHAGATLAVVLFSSKKKKKKRGEESRNKKENKAK